MLAVWSPEDCYAMIAEGEAWSDHERKLFLQVPNAKGGDPRPRREEILRCKHEVYQHRPYQVVQACRNITWPGIERLLEDMHIYLPPAVPVLPWNGMCLGPTQIVLYGRITQIPRVMTDYVVPHEIGHAVNYAIARDYSDPDWCRFCELFGLRKVVHSTRAKVDWFGREEYLDTPHVAYPRDDYDHSWVDSPGEWFAESFRYLYGGPANDYWDLPTPWPGDAVRDFFETVVRAGFDKRWPPSPPAE